MRQGSGEEDLTQARKKKTDKGKSSLQAEREALKAEMRRGIKGKQDQSPRGDYSEEEDVQQHSAG
jgi:hypothetical protein